MTEEVKAEEVQQAQQPEAEKVEAPAAETAAPAAEQAAPAEASQEVTEQPAAESAAAESAAAASEEPAAEQEVSEIDQVINSAIAFDNDVISALGRVLQGYVAKMGKSKGTDYADIIEQNTQLWVVLRKAVNTGSSFRDSMRLILMVFRLNPDGAFSLPMLLRGIDGVNSRLNADHRAGYTGLVTIIEAASRLANPSKVGQMINLSSALQSSVFTDEARQRVVGFFSE